jgi:hypothetical protein
MPCTTCGQGYGSGNTVSGIPIKDGHALSSANERAVIMGSIPQVVRHPAWTLVGGKAVAGITSNGGISNPSNFFKNRIGVYFDKNGQSGGSTCA